MPTNEEREARRREQAERDAKALAHAAERRRNLTPEQRAEDDAEKARLTQRLNQMFN